jgi:CheY-like chemotaxis protein
MMMPVMDGLALLAAVREARADVPFILMSGLLDRATPRGGQPPDVVLSKPFEPEALLAAVGRLCGD